MAHHPSEQARLRPYIKDDPEYFPLLANAYFSNPFLVLTDEEKSVLSQKLMPEALRGLVEAREDASRFDRPKIAVFCMPKSGSSFVQSAVCHALQVPHASATSFGTEWLSSYFGMNAREQELDELAIIKSIITSQDGLVFQTHTRYSTYLAFQIRRFGLFPIVTVRNILDCIVSFDDMMMTWRTRGGGAWTNDGPFALPLSYAELDAAERYDLLGRSFGVWLVNFFLSWRRCERQGVIRPLFIRYEDDILDGARLARRLREAAGLSEEQAGRLEDYVRNPDRERSRLNVGRSGRGRTLVPQAVSASLEDYARLFADEIGEEDIAYLLR
jgi:hypothetical protein